MEVYMKFTKMHGCGNDYIYVNGFAEHILSEQKPDIVKRLSDRHFGIGGDGIIFINPSDAADFEMEMYNGDGSRAEMCGNGVRCVAKYVYDNKMTDNKSISILSAGKIKYLDLQVNKENTVDTVTVNMGSPILVASQIPVLTTEKEAVNLPIEVEGIAYQMTCVSMGNPHAIVFTPDAKVLNLEKIGPAFENHSMFPNRINTEFVHIMDRENVFMRVWERGSGETLACGTGACATMVACVLNGLTDEKITVHLLGGDLLVEWDRVKNLVYMTGPAVTVFEGEIPI